MLAHELRNPLGPIRNAAQLLQQQGPEAPHVRQARAIIERQVGHQARLLFSLLLPALASSGSDAPPAPAATSDELPPAADPTPQEVGTASLRAQGPRGGRRTVRVLIVEDNPDAAETLRDVLEFSGHTVEVAYSGSDAVQAAQPTKEAARVGGGFRRHPRSKSRYFSSLRRGPSSSSIRALQSDR